MVSTQFAGLVQHAMTADGLVNVLVDNMVVYLHVIVNDMCFLTALFPIWSIDFFTTCGPLLVALLLVFHLLLCYDPDYLFPFYLTISDSFPLTHTVEQLLLVFQKNNRLLSLTVAILFPSPLLSFLLYCSTLVQGCASSSI